MPQASKSLATPLDERCNLNNAFDVTKRISIFIIPLYFKNPCFLISLRSIFLSTLFSKTRIIIIPITFIIINCLIRLFCTQLHVPTQRCCRSTRLHSVIMQKKNCNMNLYNRKKSPLPRAGKKKLLSNKYFVTPKINSGHNIVLLVKRIFKENENRKQRFV